MSDRASPSPSHLSSGYPRRDFSGDVQPGHSPAQPEYAGGVNGQNLSRNSRYSAGMGMDRTDSPAGGMSTSGENCKFYPFSSLHVFGSDVLLLLLSSLRLLPQCLRTRSCSSASITTYTASFPSILPCPRSRCVWSTSSNPSWWSAKSHENESAILFTSVYSLRRWWQQSYLGIAAGSQFDGRWMESGRMASSTTSCSVLEKTRRQHHPHCFQSHLSS